MGDEPGITRDRIYGEYEWAGRHYRLVDTGGIVPDDPELIPTEIYNQAKVALKEADALVMVVDARTELARPDYDLARLLKRGGKPVFLAVNKVEAEAMAAEAENFRRLGIRDVYAVSSEHGQGIGELLDAIAEAVPQRQRVASQKSASRRKIATSAQAERRRWGTREDLRQTRAKRTTRSKSGRTGSLSSTRRRWRLSGGRMWARARC